MYSLITITLLNATALPIIDNVIIYKNINDCESRIFEIYEKKKKLTANYPARVKFIENNRKEKMMAFTYKLDYTKPEQTSYYQCKKAQKK